MVTAFVLIRTEGKDFPAMADKMLEVPGVKEVHVVAGEYDMVAIVRVVDACELSAILTRQLIHIPGISWTKTLIALETFSPYDVESLFGGDG
ncbi:MAG: Lrp/AsnC family transcriptional regulator [Kiritimatiellaeota bacterium]|nr:Lrp/AsnC family transcriptional regulator [Kiritimatiellota bacterium]